MNHRIDERLFFSQDELVQALSKIMPAAQARTLAQEVTSQECEVSELTAVHLSESVLELLSLVSENCAERVRKVLNLTPDELHRMKENARDRYGL